MQKTFTFIDLFAGIGGFRIALERVGGRCLKFSEINNDAIQTYCTNFAEEADANLGDITKVQALPEHDLLTGGVPCQSWSIAGKNLGFDDDRGQLWNDTIFLLNQAKPKAFIFENVKGLVDPRNQRALAYILERLKLAGYSAGYYVLNAFDYGVPQSRVRIYIVGFRDEVFFKAFQIPQPFEKKLRLANIIGNDLSVTEPDGNVDRDLFGNVMEKRRGTSLSYSNGFNDYFLFNDIRNGDTTIHSWDIVETTDKQKKICLLLLKNRRKSCYGTLDGNPLSLNHFKALDNEITQDDLDGLVKISILKPENYAYTVNFGYSKTQLTDEEKLVLSMAEDNRLITDVLTAKRIFKVKKVSVSAVLDSLVQKSVLVCAEVRYDFKYTKISTGLFGVNRVFLPSSNIFPTLVASDSNDFISTVPIKAANEVEYKRQFIENVYKKGNYRKITKREACRIQGFPENFILPDSRSRWMKLLGNSVSAPVIEMLGKAICQTGVFDK